MFVALQRSCLEFLWTSGFSSTTILDCYLTWSFKRIFAVKVRVKWCTLKWFSCVLFQLLPSDKNNKAYTHILKLSFTCQIVLTTVTARGGSELQSILCLILWLYFFAGGGGGRERHFLCGDIQVIKSRPL